MLNKWDDCLLCGTTKILCVRLRAVGGVLAVRSIRSKEGRAGPAGRHFLCTEVGTKTMGLRFLMTATEVNGACAYLLWLMSMIRTS